MSNMSTERLIRALVDRVQQEYRLAEVGKIASVPKDVLRAAQSRNDSDTQQAYKIETTSGLFCLKRHRNNRSRDHIELQSALLQAAQHDDLDICPTLVDTVDGASYFSFEDGYWWLERF